MNAPLAERMGVERVGNPLSLLYTVRCRCRTITWDAATAGDGVVVRCSRCNIRNYIPGKLPLAPPTAAVAASVRAAIAERVY